MELNFGEIFSYVGTAIGAGGLTQLANWRFNKKKNAAELKADEIENMRKAMEDFYKPLVEQQNHRIRQLEGEVNELRAQLVTERHDHQRQINDLQKQIVAITQALGIKANARLRDPETGQFLKKGEA